LRPDDATAAEWPQDGKLPLSASPASGFEWTSDGIWLQCGGTSIANPGEFPVIGNVANSSSAPVTIRIRHVVSDGSPIVGERGPPQRDQERVPIVDGEPFVLPRSSGTVRLRLRADREWTPDYEIRVGDTVSYDIEIESASGTTTCRLRMVIARRWSDTFDEWWQPIVWVPLLPVAVIWYGVLWVAMGGHMID